MELFNSTTKKWVEAYLNNPKAATIIETNDDNESGVVIAKHLYEKLVESKTIPFFTIKVDKKNSIGIEDIKELKDYFSLKANIDGKHTRFVVVPDAEKMTIEAQNSILKLIEELPERTLLVLIVNDSSKILATILSRCFLLKILPIEYEKAWIYAQKNKILEADFKKYYLLSEGNTSVFVNYIHGRSNDTDDLIKYSKDFISSNEFDRQKIITDYSKAGYDPLKLVKAIQLISKSTMRSTKSIKSKRRWKQILEKAIFAEKQLNSNVNSKLVLLSLSVSI